MSQDPVDRLAQALLQARRDHALLDASAHADTLQTPEQAYAVQLRVLAALGGEARAWKTGGPSRAAMPTHAPLPSAGVLASESDASAFPLHVHLVEPEVAFRLGRDVTAADAAHATTPEVESWLDAMAVSIELVDFRWREAGAAPALLKLADFQAHGALVLGAFQPYRAVPWERQRGSARIGRAAAKHWQGTHALGSPTWGLPAWLRHATRETGTLKAGTVVTTGTWAGMLPAVRGDRIVVRFDGIGEAAVTL